MKYLTQILKTSIFVFLLFLSLFSIPIATQAQTSCQIYNPNSNNFGPNCIPLIKNLKLSKEGLSGLIILVANYAIFIIGALGVLMIVYAGFLLITDGGAGERAGRARKIIFNVLLGIVLAIASFTIVSLLTGFVSTLDLNNLGTSSSSNSSSGIY